MTSLIIIIAAFVGVASLVGAAAYIFRGDTESSLEQRLEMLAGSGGSAIAGGPSSKNLVLARPFDEGQGILEDFVARLSGLRRIFEQADTNLSPSKFVVLSAVLAGAGGSAFIYAGIHPALVPIMAVCAGLLPFAWLLLRRRKRLAAFGSQLSDSLELIGRALRAGHSLAAGFNLVATEMPDPIAKEFGRVFEEQNLGVPLEDALQSITERIPNLDLRFFATAIILQRQTGGDLAEILDKISHLIRERYALLGQVQALTGEGRLSGVVLLALPPLLFGAVWRLNPDYIMVLFTDPMGKKMLIGGVLLQLLGALVIRKIVNIKV